ncbi:hypothetical protein [Alkalinema pantanalense]|uniref:hypothetical protein n=1 Tax=Alkalinema pantanalense TaxID=1620705 RepID=UPI003D6F1C13
MAPNSENARYFSVRRSRLVEVGIEAGVEAIAFLGVAGTAEGLEVAEVVAATVGEGDDVIDFEFGVWASFATAFALVVVAIEDVLAHRFRNRDSDCFVRHGDD